MKIVNIEEENLNLLNDLSNFNEIFRKVLTYDNIRSQKSGFHLLSHPAFLGLTECNIRNIFLEKKWRKWETGEPGSLRDQFQTSLSFLKKFYEVKADGQHLSFNTFWQSSTWTIQRYVQLFFRKGYGITFSTTSCK